MSKKLDLKMKLLLLLVLILPCHARMGWTREQMEAKYGKHTKTKSIPGTSFMTHMYVVNKGTRRYAVFATYVKDKVESVSYVNVKGDWSKAEIKALLKLNSEGEVWTEKSAGMTYFWTRPTGQAFMDKLEMDSLYIISTLSPSTSPTASNDSRKKANKNGSNPCFEMSTETF